MSKRATHPITTLLDYIFLFSRKMTAPSSPQQQPSDSRSSIFHFPKRRKVGGRNVSCFHLATALMLLLMRQEQVAGFSPFSPSLIRCGNPRATTSLSPSSRLYLNTIIIIADDDDDDDDMEPEEEEDEEDSTPPDPYLEAAKSEFEETTSTKSSSSSSSALAPFASDPTPTTRIDWGGAYGKLRQRVQDNDNNKSPSDLLYQSLKEESPNQLIGQFISTANPTVVQAMSGAVTSLLGGLSGGGMGTGVETLVRAPRQKMAHLCFQLQMTGYMFRNAEYVVALKDLLQLPSTESMSTVDLKVVFDQWDTDGDGYIDTKEIKHLFDSVAYQNKKTPAFEVQTFLEFFDADQDGKISWKEFEAGFVTNSKTGAASAKSRALRLLGGSVESSSSSSFDDEDDEDDDVLDQDLAANITGKIKVELEDGQIVQVDAKEYMETLQQEAAALRQALRQEAGLEDERKQQSQQPENPLEALFGSQDNNGAESVLEYIASRQGDFQSLTKGISPDIVDTMKRLVEFVLRDDELPKDDAKGNKSLWEEEDPEKQTTKDSEEEMVVMEVPGSALQQLALWQLVLGYRLRENEATGEYLKLIQ